MFSWIPIYQEFSQRLVDFEQRQGELITMIEEARQEGLKPSPLQDKDAQGRHFLLKEIDPFTVLATFNHGLTAANRTALLVAYKRRLRLKSPIPDDFAGVPEVMPAKTWFIAYSTHRERTDVPRLWLIFQIAMSSEPLNHPDFASAFDEALKVWGTSFNLTMGLFWARPDVFLSLDSKIRQYLGIKLHAKALSADLYIKTMRKVRTNGRKFFELSRDASSSGEDARVKAAPDDKQERGDRASAAPQAAYGPDNLLAEGAFLEKREIEEILERLKAKKNLILQGPPGVGKTFLARKIAYALMEQKDENCIQAVQFHQSYAYEDFVRGFRPTAIAGNFELTDGTFLQFCSRAAADREKKYVLLVDEINRGNLSQIFGELLSLIETDKREPSFALRLAYHRDDEQPFYVPSNLYIIGMMNLADRSLAMVDYALRRRFSFVELEPKFEGEGFQKWLRDRSMSAALIDLIVNRLGVLNETIRKDTTLGRHYMIGHSCFCPPGEDFSSLGMAWFELIVKTEIVPLLDEYWFDAPERTEAARRILLSL